MNHTISLSSRPALWTALQAIADRLRRRCGAWRRLAEARQTHLALRGLDERTLRDVGFDRSEAGSLAAELDGRVGPTRVRVLQAFHSLRM